MRTPLLTLLLALLLACAHTRPLDIPPPIPHEDAVAVLATALDVPYPAAWRPVGPCLFVWAVDPPQRTLTLVRCGPVWAATPNVTVLVQQLRDEGTLHHDEASR